MNISGHKCLELYEQVEKNYHMCMIYFQHKILGFTCFTIPLFSKHLLFKMMLDVTTVVSILYSQYKKKDFLISFPVMACILKEQNQCS